MARTYQYRAQTQLLTNSSPPGVEAQWAGVQPTDNSWHTTSTMTGNAQYKYFYTDTNAAASTSPQFKLNNSTQVQVTATDDWRCRIDSNNNLIVTVHTVIEGISRVNKRGNPNSAGNYTRDIVIRREPNGSNLFTKNGDPIGYVHKISGRVDLGTETFTIAPGANRSRGSVYLLNHTTGFPWQTTYMDEMWAGISFRNTLPRPTPPSPEPEPEEQDYRPGAIWDGSTWQSINRTRGGNGIFCGSSYNEMRTVEGTGNPPEILCGGRYKDMAKIGANAG